MTSYSNKKQLRFVITLGTGKFGSSNNNQITLEGYRASVDIDKAGGAAMSTLRARVFGVRQEDMNSVTTLQWKPGTLIPNTVQVFAIDGDKTTLIFGGNIVNAWGDYQSMPDVYLHIQAQSAFFGQLQPVPPRSFKGQIDAASVVAQIAADMGYAFENNGVNVQLSNVYLAGTALDQAKDICRAAGCTLYVDDSTMAITPLNQPRQSQAPKISPQTGLVGYPTFDGIGVNFTALFNPAVLFGGLFTLETDVRQAAGQWIASSLLYNLESERPGGAWFMEIRGTANGLAVTRR